MTRRPLESTAITRPLRVVCRLDVVEACDFPVRACEELGEDSCATPVVFNCPGKAVMPELAARVRAVETLLALLAVVSWTTTMVIKSPTLPALKSPVRKARRPLSVQRLPGLPEGNSGTWGCMRWIYAAKSSR